MAKPKQKKKSRKKKISDPRGIANIKATFNNTHISVTDKFGNVIAWATAGTSGFKGSRKNTSYAATIAAENVAKEVISMGMISIDVRSENGTPLTTQNHVFAKCMFDYVFAIFL